MTPLNPVFLALVGFNIFFVVLYPLVAGFLVHRRLHVSWRYFLYGAVIFLVFQLLTRVPAVQVLQVVFGPQLRASPVLLWSWLAGLALTAGIFEEVGRYVGYRVFMRHEDKTWAKAVMYGIGHGGLESILLVGGTTLLTLVNLLVIQSGGLDQIPAPQRAAAAQQIQAIAAQPVWAALLGSWERLWTLPVHVACSVLVLQVFRRHSLVWLWIAIAAHSLVDLTSVGLAQALGSSLSTSLLVEGVIAVFGVIALWIVFLFRDPELDPVAALEP